MDENTKNTQASEQQNQQQAQPIPALQEPNAAEQQAEKLFTQADVDRIVGNRLARLKQEAGDIDRYRQERDDARRELEQFKNNAFLEEQGVAERYRDYVVFEANKRVDDKTDFRQAVEKFLKENPSFAGKGFRVVSTGIPDGGSGTGGFAHDAEIRKAMGLKG